MAEDTSEIAEATLEHDIQGKAGRIFNLSTNLAEQLRGDNWQKTKFTLTYPDKPADIQWDGPQGKHMMLLVEDDRTLHTPKGETGEFLRVAMGIKLNGTEMKALPTRGVGPFKTIENPDLVAPTGETMLHIVKSLDRPGQFRIGLGRSGSSLPIEQYSLGRGLLDKVEAQLKETPTSAKVGWPEVPKP